MANIFNNGELGIKQLHDNNSALTQFREVDYMTGIIVRAGKKNPSSNAVKMCDEEEADEKDANQWFKHNKPRKSGHGKSKEAPSRRTHKLYWECGCGKQFMCDYKKTKMLIRLHKKVCEVHNEA
jgi:hypothetical protein